MFCPFVVLIVASRLQSFDRFLEWAAADLGASPRQTIRHIVLPLIAPAFFTGLAHSFVRCMTAISSVFGSPFTTVTIGTALWWLPMMIPMGTLLAVPMFIFAAALFNVTGLTTQLFDFIRMVIGRELGGDALVLGSEGLPPLQVPLGEEHLEQGRSGIHRCCRPPPVRS